MSDDLLSGSGVTGNPGNDAAILAEIMRRLQQANGGGAITSETVGDVTVYTVTPRATTPGGSTDPGTSGTSGGSNSPVLTTVDMSKLLEEQKYKEVVALLKRTGAKSRDVAMTIPHLISYTTSDTKWQANPNSEGTNYSNKMWLSQLNEAGDLDLLKPAYGNGSYGWDPWYGPIGELLWEERLAGNGYPVDHWYAMIPPNGQGRECEYLYSMVISDWRMALYKTIELRYYVFMIDDSTGQPVPYLSQGVPVEIPCSSGLYPLTAYDRIFGDGRFDWGYNDSLGAEHDAVNPDNLPAGQGWARFHNQRLRRVWTNLDNTRTMWNCPIFWGDYYYSMYGKTEFSTAEIVGLAYDSDIFEFRTYDPYSGYYGDSDYTRLDGSSLVPVAEDWLVYTARSRGDDPRRWVLNTNYNAKTDPISSKYVISGPGDILYPPGLIISFPSVPGTSYIVTGVMVTQIMFYDPIIPIPAAYTRS